MTSTSLKMAGNVQLVEMLNQVLRSEAQIIAHKSPPPSINQDGCMNRPYISLLEYKVALEDGRKNPRGISWKNNDQSGQIESKEVNKTLKWRVKWSKMGRKNLLLANIIDFFLLVFFFFFFGFFFLHDATDATSAKWRRRPAAAGIL